MNAVAKTRGAEYLTGITACQINALLAEKHKNDVFVDECKNGPSYGRGLLRLDAWVLRKTWSPPTTIGYEIKVDRMDFEQDQKWAEYLPVCNEFYFVCPAGLIRSQDLDDRVGLIWVSKSGVLHTKKRSTKWKPDPLKIVELMSYVLMARTRIVGDMWAAQEKEPAPVPRLEVLRAMVEEAAKKKTLAHFIRGHVRDTEVLLQKKEGELNNRELYLHQFEEKLEKLGIVWDSSVDNWRDTNRVANEIGKLKKVIDWDTMQHLNSLAHSIKDVVKDIEELRKEENKEAQHEQQPEAQEAPAGASSEKERVCA